MSKSILESYVRESLRQINEATSLKDKIKSLNSESTYGELKSVLNSLVSSKKAKKGADIAKNLIGIIPGLDTADKIVDVYGLLKGLYKLKDDVRPNNFLANFDIDDAISKIVDNDLEDEFIKELTKRIENISNSKKIGNFNMTEQLKGFLARKFNNRTITGFPKKK